MKKPNGKLHLVLLVLAMLFLLFIYFIVKARNLSIESRKYQDSENGRSVPQMQFDSTGEKSNYKKMIIL